MARYLVAVVTLAALTPAWFAYVERRTRRLIRRCR